VLGSFTGTLPNSPGGSAAQTLLDAIESLVFGESAEAATIPNNPAMTAASGGSAAVGWTPGTATLLNNAAQATGTRGWGGLPWLDPVFRQFGGGAGVAGAGGSFAAIPNVGGILFDNCAAQWTGIGEITGAYWDAQNGSLVLVGRDGKGPGAPVCLPQMDREHFLVALRAYLAGMPIGVSIDPPAEYRDGMKRGVTPPDGTPMLVSYLGRTEGTLFGAIMFEADRLLKCLDKGVDNRNREPLAVSVPGFRSLLEMIRPGESREENVWHRFWFVIDKVELRQDPATGALAFGDVRLKVLTEVEKEGQGGERPVDAHDQAFVQHLTTHFDEYAQEFPVLARLKELAKVAAVAKLLCQQETAFDLTQLFFRDPQHVDTPRTTPGIKVTSPNVEVEQRGNVTTTRTVSLFGGVDLDPEPRVRPDDGAALRLRQRAQAARPSPSIAAWTIGHNGSSLAAQAIQLRSLRRPGRWSVEDHRFPGDPTGLLRFCRVYDSVASHTTDFGPGWRLWIPYALRVVGSSGKRAEVLTRQEVERPGTPPVLVLHDYQANCTTLYRRVSAQDKPRRAAFCRVTSQTTSGHTTSYQYDPSDRIFAVDEGFVIERDGRQYNFDRQGLLTTVHLADGGIVSYQWQQESIVRIAGPAGAYTISYDRSCPKRIFGVQASDGFRLEYVYDDHGSVVVCLRNGKIGEAYGYDFRSRLAEVRNGAGQVLLRCIYDDFGNVVAAPGDAFLSAGGHRLQRAIDALGRLEQVRDDQGGSAQYRYGTDGQLTAVEIAGRSGQRWRFGYDADGRLALCSDPCGQTLALEYDSQRRIQRMVAPGDDGRAYRRDQTGRLIGIEGPYGKLWEIGYSAAGEPQAVVGSDGERWMFRWRAGMPVWAEGPSLSVHTVAKRAARIVQTVEQRGMKQKQEFDSGLRLRSQRTRGAGAVEFDYDAALVVRQVRNPAGVLAYAVDEDALAVTVTFAG
jgi:YD repeat-containing protein